MRTTSVIRRSCSCSRPETVAQRYMVGRTAGSIRSKTPASSRRVNRSPIDTASRTARNCAVKLALMTSANSGPGCTVARSGAMPCPSSRKQTSMPVSPAPTTT